MLITKYLCIIVESCELIACRVVALLIATVAAISIGYVAGLSLKSPMRHGVEVTGLRGSVIGTGFDVEYLLEVKNLRKDAFVASAFQTSCGCVRLADDKLVVPAGMTSKLKLLLDTRPKSPKEAESSQNRIGATIIPVENNIGASMIAWELDIDIFRPLHLSSGRLTLSGHDGDTVTATTTLYSTFPLTEVQARCESESILVSTIKETDSRFQVNVSAECDAITPYISRTVDLVATDVVGDIYSIPLTVQIKSEHNVAVTNKYIDCGILPIGMTSSNAMILNSQTSPGRSFTIDSVHATPLHGDLDIYIPDTILFDYNISDNCRVSIDIEVCPRSPGLNLSRVDIIVRELNAESTFKLTSIIKAHGEDRPPLAYDQ